MPMRHTLLCCLVSSAILTQALAASQDSTAPDSTATPTAPRQEPLQAPNGTDVPDGKAVLARHIEALGGRKRLDAISSSSFRMSTTTPNGEIVFTLAAKKPGKFHMRQKLADREMVQVCDGTEAWVQPEKGGRYSLVNAMMRDHFVSGTDVQGLMRNLDSRFTSVTNKGVEKFNGVDCYVLSMQEPGGPEFSGYFALDTGLVMGKRTADTSGPVPFVETQTFTDWVEIDGIKVFRTLRVDANGLSSTLTFTDFVFDSVDDALFERPAEVQRLVEQRDAAARQAPAQPTPPPATTSPPGK